jgi:hypothetical protein
MSLPCASRLLSSIALPQTFIVVRVSARHMGSWGIFIGGPVSSSRVQNVRRPIRSIPLASHDFARRVNVAGIGSIVAGTNDLCNVSAYSAVLHSLPPRPNPVEERDYHRSGDCDDRLESHLGHQGQNEQQTEAAYDRRGGEAKGVGLGLLAP